MRRLALTLALLAACHTTPRGLERPRTVVLILADDLGACDPGCFGHGLHATPNIDRLAAQGTVFAHAYAGSANCAPSRAAVMSGLYAPRTGVYTVGNSARGRAEDRRLVPVPNTTDLAAEHVTLAEVLGSAGLRTGVVGKWHLGVDETGPAAQGFDFAVTAGRAGSTRSYHAPFGLTGLPEAAEGTHLTDLLTGEAQRFLEEPGDAFLYFAPFAVHTPIQPSSAALEAAQERLPAAGARAQRYAALVQDLDVAVGRLMQTLEHTGRADDALVLFLSDNGGHGAFTACGHLRGEKGTFYEGGLRTPLIVRWPGRVAAGGSSDAPILGIDLLPTLAHLTGAELPAGVPFDGIDLTSLWLEGEAPAERPLFWHFPAYLEAYDKNRGPWRTTPVGAIRRGRYKLLEFFEDASLELYDLEQDPGEATNLAASQPQVTADLASALDEWRKGVQAAMPRVARN